MANDQGEKRASSITGKVKIYDGQEYIAGIKVTLRGLENRSAMETSTDFSGRFEFHGLIPDITYVIKAYFSDLKTDDITVRLDESLDLGNLVLTQA